jgi:hypothetical protein
MLEDREIILFQNIRQVILAEQWCRNHQLPVKVIPVPKPWSSECGMCLEMNQKDGNLLVPFLNEQGIVAQRLSLSS